MSIEFVQVSTTGDRREILESLANDLVESKLAACCQLEGPMTSFYRWQGAVETVDEYRLLIKTRRELYREVEQRIVARHNYDQPQITAVAIVECEQGYQQWLVASIRDAQP